MASGRPANAQSDAWGLGALLFACVQGVPPYDRGTPLATLSAVVQDPVPAYPAAGRLAGVIRGLLVKDPATRMSVGTAHQAMLRIASDSGLLVTHAWQPRPARTRRHRRSGRRGRHRPSGRRGRRRPDRLRPRDPRLGRPPPDRGMYPGPGMSGALPTPPWAAAPDLPPPPWAGAGASALRAIPVQAPVRSPRRKLLLTLTAALVALIAAAAGYLGVRTIAHLENGAPVFAARPAVVATHY